jgi:hypothetical protein
MFGSFGKFICSVGVASSLLVACGPAASLNNNEGGSCSAANNNCGGDLDCQPIQGRTGEYCCPTPPQSSSAKNCQPVGNTSF